MIPSNLHISTLHFRRKNKSFQNLFRDRENEREGGGESLSFIQASSPIKIPTVRIYNRRYNSILYWDVILRFALVGQKYLKGAHVRDRPARIAQ